MTRLEISHLFIVSISISDIAQVLSGLIPQVILTVGNYPVKNDFICIGSGFLTFALAVTNIMHIAVVSVIRAIGLKLPMFYYKNCKKRHYKVFCLCFCYAYGFVWASLPLIGWSKYEVDVDHRRCSLDWKLTRKDTFSFILNGLIFCFFLPGILISIALFISNKTSYRKKFKNQIGHGAKQILEKVYLKVFAISAIAFIVVWTPYVVLTFLTMLKIEVPSHLFSISAFFAKLSSITNALANCYINKSFQKQLLNLNFFSCLKRKRASVSPKE